MSNGSSYNRGHMNTIIESSAVIRNPESSIQLAASKRTEGRPDALPDTPTPRLADTVPVTLSRSTLSTPPEAVQLKYFSDPLILQRLGHNRLARLLQDFERDLMDALNPLPFPSPEDPTSLDRLAAALRRTPPLPL